jgi:hypothetical protein
VAKRCIATTICAVQGEEPDQKETKELIERYSASEYFTPNEKTFLAIAKPSKQERVDHTWQYECVHVFLWSLNFREGLKPANEICSVPEDVGVLNKKVVAKEFVEGSKLRSKSEILDMVDLYYRLHWAAIELRIKGNKSDKIDEGIIRERHKALNWLIGYMNQEWDDVTTDT